MSLKKKIILSIVLVSAVLLLLSATLLPWLVRSKAEKAINQATGRAAHIDSISFNPFTLTATISGFGIEGEQGAPFVKVGSMRVSVGSVSIFKRALVIDELTVNAPSLSFARLDANRYSFSDIVEHQKKKPKEESKSDLRYSINNIRISDGSIDFDDRSVDGGRNHKVRKLELTVPFISNIPHLLDTYTDPSFSAVINDAAIQFNGKTKPLSKSRETTLKIKLDRLDLPGYTAYSPVKLPVELASGKLTVDSEVKYRISSDKSPELDIKGLVQLDGVTLKRPGGSNLLNLPQLKLNAASLEIFSKRFAFDSVLLEGLEIFASRDKKGVWMYSSLLKPSANPGRSGKSGTDSAQTAVKKDKSEKAASFSVGKLAVSNGSVHFSDAQPAGGFKTTVSDIDINIDNLDNSPGKSAIYDLSMLLDNQATLAADGTFSIAPLTATASVELSDLLLQKGWPYLSGVMTAPLKGSLNSAFDLSYSPDQGLDVKNGALDVKGLSATYGTRERFELALLDISGFSFNQKGNSAAINDIRLSKGSVSLSKSGDGSISLMSLFKSSKGAATTVPPKATATAKKKNGAKPFSWSLKRFQLDRFNAAFTDNSREEKPKFTLTNSLLSLTNLKGPVFSPAGLIFASTFNGQTPLKASGKLTPLPFRYQGDISIGSLQIRDFEDYFPDSINIFVVDGSLDSNMNLDIAIKDGKPVGSFKGNFGLRSFHAIDTVAEEDLLKWESLQFDQIQGSLAPLSLGIREVALNNVYSRIEIRKDGTLNLQNLVKKEGTGEQKAMESGQKSSVSNKDRASKPANSEPAAKTPISIGAITIQDGTISFTDRHLKQTFNSTFYHLGGRVSGLSSEDSKFADVDLRGNLENHSPMQITGRINPLRDDLFIDLKLSFKDIDLTPVTPYSGTYLGYTVEKGKLFLDLKYLIDKKLLSSENNVFIDQFTFGSKVESEKATSLPVRLAVALLKDRKGEIHLDLPVSGRTDDPQFSIWGVVWQVFKNLITKAVTSPFALLSSMMGGGQDFSSIQFAVGSSKLAAVEEQKLTVLAKALADRPGLKVEIKGYVERAKDAEAYRQELLNLKLRNEKFLTLAKERQVKTGDSPDSIQIAPEEYSRLLKSVYKKEKFPKPRNVIGLVKDLPDTEMVKLIIANTVVGETELQTLARDRATSVMNYLGSKGGLQTERLFQKNDDIHKSPEKEGTVRSRVEFNAIAQ